MVTTNASSRKPGQKVTSSNMKRLAGSPAVEMGWLGTCHHHHHIRRNRPQNSHPPTTLYHINKKLRAAARSHSFSDNMYKAHHQSFPEGIHRRIMAPPRQQDDIQPENTTSKSQNTTAVRLHLSNRNTQNLCKKHPRPINATWQPKTQLSRSLQSSKLIERYFPSNMNVASRLKIVPVPKWNL